MYRITSNLSQTPVAPAPKAPEPPFEWTPERVNMLRELVANRTPPKKIAAFFGVGRGSIMGKMNRLGLVSRSKQAKKPPSGKGYRMEQLKPSQCRWPEGDLKDDTLRFCGKPAATGKPYCERHCRRAYQRGS